jgi:hypothetical protein
MCCDCVRFDVFTTETENVCFLGYVKREGKKKSKAIPVTGRGGL